MYFSDELTILLTRYIQWSILPCILVMSYLQWTVLPSTLLKNNCKWTNLQWFWWQVIISEQFCQIFWWGITFSEQFYHVCCWLISFSEQFTMYFGDKLLSVDSFIMQFVEDSYLQWTGFITFMSCPWTSCIQPFWQWQLPPLWACKGQCLLALAKLWIVI